ncbi:hypothetical protein OSTOST_06479 [Ostertagia ostertagi]
MEAAKMLHSFLKNRTGAGEWITCTASRGCARQPNVHHSAPLQEARIEALLDEMRPLHQRSRPHRISQEDAPPPSPPSYDVVFQPKHAPPPYSQLVLRPVQSVWTVLDREPLSKPKIRPTWADSPKPLKSMQKMSLTDDSTTSTFSLPDDSVTVDDVDCGITPRNTPRQASFMAAMTRQEIHEQDNDGT